MDTTQLMAGVPPGNYPLAPTNARHLTLLYKVQMVAVSTLLIYGICSTSIGIPNLFNTFSKLNVKISGAIDTSTLTFKENLHFEINTEEVRADSALAVTGVLAIALSAGILFGMACRNYH